MTIFNFIFSQNFISLFWDKFHDETDLRVRVLNFFHFAVAGISNAVSFRRGQVLVFSLNIIWAHFCLPCSSWHWQHRPHVGLAFFSVWWQPRMRYAHKSSYLSTVNRLPVHQPETLRTWVTGMMWHTRSYLSSVKRYQETSRIIWAMFTCGLQNLLGCENVSPIFEV